MEHTGRSKVAIPAQTFVCRADDGAWVPLPDWARYFMRLGSWLAEEPLETSRTVVALVVPARAQVAATVAAGLVRHRVQRPSTNVDPTEHMQRLCSAQIGQPVYVSYASGDDKEGVIKGAKGHGASLELLVTIATGDKKHGSVDEVIPLSQAHRVRLSDRKFVNLPKDLQARVMQPVQGLARNAMGSESAARRLGREHGLECVVVGSRGALEADLCHTPIGMQVNPTLVSDGCLQDLVRAKEFLDEGLPYRTSVLTAASAKEPTPPFDETPHVAIFDGALGFVKWRHLYPRSHWLVVIDRTEARCAEGVDAVRDEFRRHLPSPARPPYGAPGGFELVAFKRGMR